MKIFLVRPPARFMSGSAKPSAIVPMGLVSIIVVLEKPGYAVDVYDV